ncbi:hypothetical protein D3C83_25560 [compost metagenome]
MSLLVYFASLPADHVPGVLVAVASDAPGVVRQDFFQEFGKRARPVAGTVLLRESEEIPDKLALALGLIGIGRHRFTSRYGESALKQWT